MAKNKKINQQLDKHDSLSKDDFQKYPQTENDCDPLITIAIAAIKSRKEPLFKKQDEEADRQLDNSTFKISMK
ncbi:hypothetical protein [Flavobacterium microcysteis]|uniref:Uncharacterized protein n=1 Tax=Flavobacterium microcysteis TaxID=2596891 RepID=A0A501QD77_9FLAO|nr:hypothetical protein [Flavobacterium microcysteis]TPD69916.1 hypothetical protein FJA49_08395 [Flavobacterium microcysteis]